MAWPAAGQTPDALYANRAAPGSAERAAELWASDVAETGSFDAAWKLARVSYWLGGHAPASERRGYLERGIAASRRAIGLQPGRPEGHFWLGANMGALAESFGILNGLKYRKSIKDALQTVLRLDPAFMNGSADRAIGRWYFKVPRLFGGSNSRAEAHLRASLQYDEHSTISRFFLAEVLLDEGRAAEARAELQRVIDAPINPDWVPEDHDYKAKASRLLDSLPSER